MFSPLAHRPLFAFALNTCVLSCFNHVWLFATLWTVAHRAPLSMGFSRQEYWSGLSWPPPEDLPNPGVEPTSPVFPASAGSSLPLAPPGNSLVFVLESPFPWYGHSHSYRMPYHPSESVKQVTCPVEIPKAVSVLEPQLHKPCYFMHLTQSLYASRLWSLKQR